jgi:hypothetical protein
LPLIAVLAIASSTNELRAQTAQEIRKAADGLFGRLDLQTQLPREPELVLPSWLDWILSWVNWVLSLFGRPWFQLLAVMLAVVLFLYTFRDSIPIWRFGRDWGWDADTAGDEAAGPQTPAAAMSAADDLARQGRHGEAMHVLLLQSLADIRRRLDEQFADSLTSREILRSARLPDQGRAALREIIAGVEWTYFGQRPAGSQDYMACRASFDRLAQSLHGAGA